MGTDWRRWTGRGAAAFFLSGGGIAPAPGADFEAGGGWTSGMPVQRGEGWSASDAAVSVSDTEVRRGRQAALLPAQAEPATARRRLPADPVLFLDLALKPGRDLALGLGKAPLLRFEGGDDTTLRLLAREEPAGPPALPTGVDAPAAAGAAHDWLRLTLRIDRAGGEWDLFADGVLRAAALPLAASGKHDAPWCFIAGSTSVDSYLDAVGISTANPLFPDLDRDGMDDRFEQGNGWGAAATTAASPFPAGSPHPPAGWKSTSPRCTTWARTATGTVSPTGWSASARRSLRRRSGANPGAGRLDPLGRGGARVPLSRTRAAGLSHPGRPTGFLEAFELPHDPAHPRGNEYVSPDHRADRPSAGWRLTSSGSAATTSANCG